MAIDEGLADWIAEAMVPIGEVTRKRLFGGATLYCEAWPSRSSHSTRCGSRPMR